MCFSCISSNIFQCVVVLSKALTFLCYSNFLTIKDYASIHSRDTMKKFFIFIEKLFIERIAGPRKKKEKNTDKSEKNRFFRLHLNHTALIAHAHN